MTTTPSGRGNRPPGDDREAAGRRGAPSRQRGLLTDDVVKRRKHVWPPPFMSAAEKRRAYRRWKRWLARIKAEITRLAMDRHIYKQVLTIVRANPTLMESPGDFFEWMRRLYIASMTVAVRRLADTHWMKPVSFMRLLDEIADHPEVLSLTGSCVSIQETCVVG